MKISTALAEVAVLYVDTAPFIYFAEGRLAYAGKMQSIFQRVPVKRMQIITSAITLPEALMKPLQAKDHEVIKRYHQLFYQTENMNLVAVSPAAGEYAAKLRAAYNLRTPDALHVACAIDSRCDAFLTNDAGIKRVKEISVLILDDLE